ncbi:3-oxoacyl-[acyl-carrier-protein] synthase III C-terminal domain-containing protein [Streptomyces sp. NPDC048644]|uniref:3-oxoacyl-[acyl-carrier-protein] synthase III C-terminal domain-containing protein n=1 Tax=Streptomyces sp. NPDC048644 TaxID=3365582 RepID=UPI0037226E57
MNHAYVSHPAVVLAPHRVTTEEIIEDIRSHHPNHEKIKSIPRHLITSRVATRYFSNPLPYVAGASNIGDRTARAYADALAMAEAAAQKALAEHHVDPAAVDVLITSNSVSGGIIPGIDIPLASNLGLRPDVRRIPLNTVACTGGALALARAKDMLAAWPDATVLVVISEPLSTTYNHRDTEVATMIFKGLFGDAAAAAVVTSKPLGAGLRIDSTLEYRLPDSAQAYFTRPDETGVHFESTKISLTAVKRTVPRLGEWMRGWQADVPVIHTGSPDIIRTVNSCLGLDEKASRHAYASLEECGNLGGVSIFDVLSRTHSEPPSDGDKTVIVAFGPGFTMTACRGIWQA